MILSDMFMCYTPTTRIIIVISIYIALYHTLLKALLHKTNEILFNKGKEMLEFESEKTIHCVK